MCMLLGRYIWHSPPHDFLTCSWHGNHSVPVSVCCLQSHRSIALGDWTQITAPFRWESQLTIISRKYLYCWHLTKISWLETGHPTCCTSSFLHLELQVMNDKEQGHINRTMAMKGWWYMAHGIIHKWINCMVKSVCSEHDLGWGSFGYWVLGSRKYYGT